MGEESKKTAPAAAPVLDPDAVPTPPKKRGLRSRIWKAIAAPLGFLILLIFYSIFGAILFKVIEGPYESHEKHDLLALRERVVNSLWAVSGAVGGGAGAAGASGASGIAAQKLQAKFAAQARDELRRYEAQLYSAFASGINSDSEKTVWDFWGSMVYAATVYTTIGYGHIYPVTDAGRVATIIYALIGVPLCLIVLAEFGKFFTVIIKYFYSFPRRLFVKDSYRVDDEFNLPLSVALGVTALYIFGGALMYMQWEDEWDYFDACYFIFISISTIGFGDVLPSDTVYFLGSFCYQLFGLALVAMVINVVMEALEIRISRARVSLLQTTKSIGIDFSTVDEEEEEGKSKTE